MPTTARDLRTLAERAGRQLADAPAEQIVRWAADTFGPRWVVAASMTDTILVHLASQVVPGVQVLFIDTGHHFPETLATRDEVADWYHVRLSTVIPRLSGPDQDAAYGPRLWQRDPDHCCALRKVEPLDRALADVDAWASGARRHDSPTRADLPMIGWDARRGKVKLNPLAAWTEAQAHAYAAEHLIVLNPLLHAGYPSIGCAPCTRPVAPREDPRSGRWPDTSKTECGIHR
jgi:phosphoadenosine phosphosulfate reductase